MPGVVRGMKNRLWYVPLLVLFGCAGLVRDCQSCEATNLGADWIVVQFDMGGQPFNCWKLRGKSISNEQKSDGIFWVSDSKHLIHISGWYNRIQVINGDFEGAAEEIGVELDRCVDGAYEPDPDC